MLLIHQRDKDLRANVAGAGAVTQGVLREHALFPAQGKVGPVVACIAAPGYTAVRMVSATTRRFVRSGAPGAVKPFLTQGIRRQHITLRMFADGLADHPDMVLHYQLQQL